MGKKKGIVLAGVCICVLLLVAGIAILQKDSGNGQSGTEVGENKPGTSKDKIVTLEQAKEQFLSDIQGLMDGKYSNLIAKEFTTSIEDAESLYKFQIIKNSEKYTTSENIGPMIDALEKFFGDTLDKSSLYGWVYMLDGNGEISDDALSEEVNYDEMIKRLSEENGTKYVVSGGLVLKSDYYAHIDPVFSNTWFSKRSLNTSLPSGEWPMKEYLYLAGVRQEEITIQLSDKEYSLSELENSVLDYVNGDAFPLPQYEELSYQIGTTRVMDMGDKDTINFVLRRVYKGIPFEYGSETSGGEYIDDFGHDYITVNYVEGTQPDTIMGFMDLKGKIEVSEEITQMIPVREALRLLSDQIGENSIYDVYGIELVYRNCVSKEEMQSGIANVMEPKWKIITVNQNDNKYTLFYVDVVTGKITNRFEYYYD